VNIFWPAFCRVGRLTICAAIRPKKLSLAAGVTFMPQHSRLTLNIQKKTYIFFRTSDTKVKSKTKTVVESYSMLHHAVRTFSFIGTFLFCYISACLLCIFLYQEVRRKKMHFVVFTYHTSSTHLFTVIPHGPKLRATTCYTRINERIKSINHCMHVGREYIFCTSRDSE
jgi:hypothetical protein